MNVDLKTVILYSLIGGVFSLIGGVLLLGSKKSSRALERYAVPFAAGALIATVFMDLLQEGLESSTSESVLMGAMIGVVGFFFLERFLRWFHHHHHDVGEDDHSHKISLVVVGDTLHNALDGVAIAASFLISFPTGVITTFAVAAHEIPHEIGDFGVLLAKGMKRRNVLIINVISALATVVAAIIVFKLGSESVLPIGWIIGVSAGFLLYIAMSDLIPSIHDSSPSKKLLDWRPVLFLLGVVVVGTMIKLAHSYVGDSHRHIHADSSLHNQESAHD